MTSKNVDEMLGSDNPEIKRLLGVEGDFGTPMGLDKDWAYRIIKLVGNYSEIFDTDGRAEHAAGTGARAECAVEGRRHPVRAADPLIL